MLLLINRSPFLRPAALFLLLSFIAEIFFVPGAFALTSGPAQPEALGFKSAADQQLVDPFTGKFSYNIPILTIGNYPINLSYNSNLSMDQEASWVGLGWNMNIGQVTRTMRGLPDDYCGDIVKKEFNMKDNLTVGGLVGRDLEIAGLGTNGLFTVGRGGSIDLKYNNYTGLSLGLTFSAGLGASKGSAEYGLRLMGTGALSTSGGGLNIQPSISFRASHLKKEIPQQTAIVGWGVTVNSRVGLQQRTLSSGVNAKGYSKSPFGSDKLFGPVTYTPQIQLPFTTTALSMSLKAGEKIGLKEYSGKISGFFSKQNLQYKSSLNQAYGFNFLDKGQKSAYALMDFNREKDAAFIPGTPNLPLTYLTPDIFQVGAQGIEGTFRAFRDNTGFVSDPLTTSGSNSGSLGYETNIGNIVKGGIDLSIVSVNSVSNTWQVNNNAISKFGFSEQKTNDPLHHVYYKKLGDPANPVEKSYYANSGGEFPVRLKLTGGSSDMEVGCSDEYAGAASSFSMDNTVKKFNNPLAASNPFQCLTVAQVRLAGLDHKNYLAGVAVPDYHIGRIIVYKEDGKRYIFGLPAYNNLQKEVTFAAGGGSDADNLVSYSGTDNSTSNNKGLDNFFSATTLPPYAYAWYLTDVLSPDYVDLTGNGPSYDDYGDFVQFHSSMYIKNYRWRTPFKKDKAQFDEQLYSLSNDNKGNYVYGERDVWYVDSITTKTQVAIFHKSPRDDAYETADENGGIGSLTLWKIDSISLYNIHDYHLLKEEAYPLVRAHFVYDYFLCPGVPNNKYSGGKLKLKELYFTYGSSYKGRHQKYEFSYLAGINQTYSLVNLDRWGVFKVNDAALPNHFFPYSIQKKSVRDNDVSAWLLNKISLPSGGYLEIEYESDDYYYVQDKRAMRMYKVIGTASGPDPSDFSNELYDNYFVFIDLEENSNSKQEAETALLNMMSGVAGQDLYFKFKVNVDKNSGTKDFVFGYCKKDPSTASYGVHLLNGKWCGWIKLKDVPLDDPGTSPVNPVSRAAMQFCRLNTPVYAFDQVNISNMENDPLGALVDLLKNASIINQIIKFKQGPNGSLKEKGIGKFFDKGSWIRLGIPGKRKLGGGARVKKLITSNNWQIIQGSEPEFKTEQEFNYELENGFSSGVATYEPLIGADEIPHRQPVNYSDEFDQVLPQWANGLAPDDSYLKEEPFGEMVFPPAEIGYSRIVTRMKVPDGLNIPGTGYGEYEFYTARDFPVITKRTSIVPERRKWKNNLSIFGKKSKDYMTVSQGYAIELNNMHGKPKRTAVFNAFGGIINETKNEYFFPGSSVKVLKENGEVKMQNLGVEEDMAADFREQSTKTVVTTSKVNLGSTVIIIYLIMPLFYLSQDKEELRFRSATTTRIIYKYGLLKKQTVSDLGAKVETENLVFNPVTASPVLTKINNQYLDPVYNFSYPAENIYKGMASAGANLNTVCNISVNGSGEIISTNYFLTGGDELLDLIDGEIFWLREVNGTKYLIKANGALSGAMLQRRMLIYRSGHRNLLGISAGAVTCLKNPLVITGNDSWKIDINNESSIINSSASTFAEGYAERCFAVPDQECDLGVLPLAFSSLMTKLLAPPNCHLFQGSATTPIYNEFLSLPSNYKNALLNYFNPNGQNDPDELIMRILITGPNTIELSVFFSNETNGSNFCNIYLSSQYNLNLVSLNGSFCFNPFTLQVSPDCQVYAEFPCEVNPIPARAPGICNDSLRLTVDSACFPLFVTTLDTMDLCGNHINTIVNPYRHNLLGTWHPDQQFALISDRSPSKVTDPLDLRTDGQFEMFDSFWKNLSGSWKQNPGKWTRVTLNTITDPDGNSLEEQDALDRYSSALIGYNYQLPVASAVNARYREVAYENFEDYYDGFPYKIPENSACYHFKFTDNINNLVLNRAHTGHYSMKINPQDSISLERPITGNFLCQSPNNSTPFYNKFCNCAGIFSPVQGKATKFILSYWQNSDFVHTSSTNKSTVPPLAGTSLEIQPEIFVDDISIQLKPVYASEEIEGWSKRDYEFTVPSSSMKSIRFSFQNNSISGQMLYIDDIRVHPFEANMKSFVFDPFTQRLMATLDENNFAAIYQYDEEGSLQEIIHETERGKIFTEYYKRELGLK